MRPMLLLQPATVRTEVMGRSRQVDKHTPLLLLQIMCIILEYSCDIASIDVIRMVTFDFSCLFVEVLDSVMLDGVHCPVPAPPASPHPLFILG